MKKALDRGDRGVTILPGFMVSNTAECYHVEEHSDEKYLNHSDWFSLRSKMKKWQLSSFLPVHRGCFPDVDTVDNSERPFIRGALHALFPQVAAAKGLHYSTLSKIIRKEHDSRFKM